MRLGRHIRESWEVPRDIWLKRYPPFVTGGPLPGGDVPVFVFHSLEPHSFGRKLDYQLGYGSPAVFPHAKFIRIAWASARRRTQRSES